MPLYETVCRECQTRGQVFRKVKERNDLPLCCGRNVERIISAAFVRPDIAPYISPATGRVINSRAAMQYDLEKSGHIIDEPGLKNDIARNRVVQEEKNFAPVAAGVDQAVRDLVNSGQIGN